jgi:hypothetical protein
MTLAAPGQLKVVFYSGAAPTRLTTLTLLGLLFDRVHFPNVRVPQAGFDPDWVAADIRRVEEIGHKDYDTWLMLQLMRYALNPEVQQFFYFTGDEKQVFGGDAMKKAGPLAAMLYQKIFGARPGFQPIFTPGHHKGLPYDATIDYPGPFFYQANALLYASEHRLPLLNDDPRIPVPAMNGMDAKHNATLLATIMAMECVQLVLPEIGELQPAQIVEARKDLRDYVRPFRLSLLGLANQLNSTITVTSDYNEIKRAAEFIANTEVYPKLEEFKNALAKAKQRGWWSRTWDLAKHAPGLAALYSAGHFPAAIGGSLKAFGGWFIAGVTEQAPRSGLHYLLKLKERASPRTEG